MKNRISILIQAIVGCSCALLLSCSGSQPRANGEAGRQTVDTKVTADAYLFDARFTRDGRLGSMRLEIFDADSVIALSGRAYLGKGALRGRITRDSVQLYFPASNQYISEATDEFLRNDSCALDIAKEELVSILRHRPPMASNPTAGRFSVISASADDTVMIATWCRKSFELKYYKTSEGWCVGSFNFRDSLGTEIQANRREVRFGARIKAGQFHVTIPPDAERITP
jgi:hypothetical protein